MVSTITETRQRVSTRTKSGSSVIQPSKTLSDALTSPFSSVPRVPTHTPSFTIGDLRRAIPPHCFQRSLIKSYSFILWDCAVIAAAVAFAAHIDTIVPSSYPSPLVWVLRTLCWLAYWAVAGCFATGLWVIGHECGHGGFANSPLGNDVPGFIIHTLLLVPYFSWKISHRRHHSNTGNLEADEVFVPSVEMKRVAKYPTHYGDVDPVEKDLTLHFTIESIWRIVNIIKMLTLGWPAYLLVNASAHGKYDPNVWNSHFNPYSQIFQQYEIPLVFMSDIGLLAVLSAIGYAIYSYSFLHVLFYYGVPYLIVNLFLVLITFLQHTDLYLPHYEGSSWDWLRGALATVDRDYGILNSIFHHITDTHVVHHLFSNMPHYHASEATKAVIPILGEFYRYDSTSVAKATWRIFGRCHVVKPDPNSKGVYWF